MHDFIIVLCELTLFKTVLSIQKAHYDFSREDFSRAPLYIN